MSQAYLTLVADGTMIAGEVIEQPALLIDTLNELAGFVWDNSLRSVNHRAALHEAFQSGLSPDARDMMAKLLEAPQANVVDDMADPEGCDDA